MAKREAKYYIYRNLNKGGFSVRHRGKVICVSDNIKASRVVFKVSAAGRVRVLKQGIRNVHAFAVCDEFVTPVDFSDHRLHQRRYPISYNPFKNDSFILGKHPIHSAKEAFFLIDKCYIF